MSWTLEALDARRMLCAAAGVGGSAAHVLTSTAVVSGREGKGEKVSGVSGDSPVGGDETGAKGTPGAGDAGDGGGAAATGGDSGSGGDSGATSGSGDGTAGDTGTGDDGGGINGGTGTDGGDDGSDGDGGDGDDGTASDGGGGTVDGTNSGSDPTRGDGGEDNQRGDGGDDGTDGTGAADDHAVPVIETTAGALASAPVLKKGKLMVRGTGDADVISLADGEDSSMLAVTVNGTTTLFSKASIKSVKVVALDGDDTVSCRAAGLKKVSIDGGTGSDDLSTTVSATLIGGAGDDALTSASGATCKLAGGSGSDEITANGDHDKASANKVSTLVKSDGSGHVGAVKFVDEAGALRITGSGGNDDIEILGETLGNSHVGEGGLLVSINGKQVTLHGLLSSVYVDGGKGINSLTVDPSFTQAPVTSKNCGGAGA